MCNGWGGCISSTGCGFWSLLDGNPAPSLVVVSMLYPDRVFEIACALF